MEAKPSAVSCQTQPPPPEPSDTWSQPDLQTSGSSTAPSEDQKTQKSLEKNDPVSLDKVSEEEAVYPDDTAEEEEVRKRQDAIKEKQFAKEREATRTQEKEDRERRSGGSVGSTMSEPIKAEPSVAASDDIAMEDEREKSEAELAMDSTVGPEGDKDVEKVEVKEGKGSLSSLISAADVTCTSADSSGNTVLAASSPAPLATALIEENFAEIPQINTEFLMVLKAALHQHRLNRENRESRSQNEEYQVRLFYLRI